MKTNQNTHKINHTWIFTLYSLKNVIITHVNQNKTSYMTHLHQNHLAVWCAVCVCVRRFILPQRTIPLDLRAHPYDYANEETRSSRLNQPRSLWLLNDTTPTILYRLRMLQRFFSTAGIDFGVGCEVDIKSSGPNILTTKHNSLWSARVVWLVSVWMGVHQNASNIIHSLI